MCKCVCVYGGCVGVDFFSSLNGGERHTSTCVTLKWDQNGKNDDEHLFPGESRAKEAKWICGWWLRWGGEFFSHHWLPSACVAILNWQKMISQPFISREFAELWLLDEC